MSPWYEQSKESQLTSIPCCRFSHWTSPRIVGHWPTPQQNELVQGIFNHRWKYLFGLLTSIFVLSHQWFWYDPWNKWHHNIWSLLRNINKVVNKRSSKRCVCQHNIMVYLHIKNICWWTRIVPHKVNNHYGNFCFKIISPSLIAWVTIEIAHCVLADS